MHKSRSPHRRSAVFALLGSLVASTTWAQSSLPAQAQAQAQVRAQIQIGANPAAQPPSVAARITAGTGLRLSPGAQRYLDSRNPDAQPGDAGLCRDQDRTFGVEHQSYGGQSPRARRQLNDCSPSLRPINVNP